MAPIVDAVGAIITSKMNKFLKRYPKLHTFQAGDIVLVASTPLGDVNMRTYSKGILLKRIGPVEWEISLGRWNIITQCTENDLVYAGEERG